MEVIAGAAVTSSQFAATQFFCAVKSTDASPTR
jgi:hypothetical protein